MMSGWKMPEFIRRGVEEQLSKSIVESVSKEEESFEKILSESLLQV